jgi:hypothetical protein
MKEMKSMVLASALLLSFGYGAMWYFGLFEGLGFHGTVAAVLGVIFTTVVAIGLMALVFYSARGHDRSAHSLWERSRRK